MRNTLSSRTISSVIAARRASRYCMTAMFARSLLGDMGGDGDVLVEGVEGRLGGVLGELDRLVHLGLDLLVHLFQAALVDPAALLQERLVQDDRVALLGLVGLLLGAVLHRVAHRVAAEAVGAGLD